jgi:hypothetical protein
VVTAHSAARSRSRCFRRSKKSRRHGGEVGGLQRRFDDGQAWEARERHDIVIEQPGIVPMRGAGLHHLGAQFPAEADRGISRCAEARHPDLAVIARLFEVEADHRDAERLQHRLIGFVLDHVHDDIHVAFAVRRRPQTLGRVERRAGGHPNVVSPQVRQIKRPVIRHAGEFSVFQGGGFQLAILDAKGDPCRSIARNDDQRRIVAVLGRYTGRPVCDREREGPREHAPVGQQLPAIDQQPGIYRRVRFTICLGVCGIGGQRQRTILLVSQHVSIISIRRDRDDHDSPSWISTMRGSQCKVDSPRPSRN